MSDAITDAYYFSASNILYLTDSSKNILAASLTAINLIKDYMIKNKLTDFKHFKYDYFTGDTLQQDDLTLTSTWYDNTKDDGTAIVSHETLNCTLVSTIIIDDLTLYIYYYKIDDGSAVTQKN